MIGQTNNANAARARELFDLGVLSAGIAFGGHAPVDHPTQATKAFTRATEWDPTMADAWLGRMRLGDDTDEVIAALYRHRDTIGREQHRLGLPQGTLAGRFDTTLGIDHPLVDATTAATAFAATLIRGADFRGADDVLSGLSGEGGRSQGVVELMRAVLHFSTQRWPDVLTALRSSTAWADPVLTVGADFMAGSACVQMGMFAEGIRRLATVVDAPVPALATQALFVIGMALREQGLEDQAQGYLQQAYARDPSFTAAGNALLSTGFRLVITSAEDVAARLDPWTPDQPEEPERAAAEGARPAAHTEDDDAVAAALAELDAQVGLASVKLQVAKLQSAAVMARVRTDRGLASSGRSMHLAFTGPPGTGKTTVARIIAKLYRGLGFLATDKVVEVSRRDLVGEHLGSTAIKTSAVIDSAMDGVLFVDEAYTLVQEGLAGGDAFGREALDTLLARMEDDRDRLIVVIAGYDAEIDRLLAANDGLASRFSRRIRFESYTPEELADIARFLAARRDSVLTSGALAALENACRPLYERFHPGGGTAPRRGIDLAGNGRFIRNVVEAAEEEREFRLAAAHDTGALSADDLMRIEATDIGAALSTVLAGLGAVGALEPLVLRPDGSRPPAATPAEQVR